MRGELVLLHLHPREAPLFRRFGISMGGLPSPPHLLLIIMGGFQSLPIILLIIMGGLQSPPLPLEL